MSSTPNPSSPRELTDAELQTQARKIEYEINRRRIVSIAGRPASVEPTEAELEYVDHEWADAFLGGLRETPDSEEVLSWLYSGIVIAHESQYERLPSVGHVAKQLTEHLADLLLHGGGEDTTDMRDLSEPPSFGGHGCKCTLYDDGDGESGPRLGVTIHAECPLHAHLLDEDEPTLCTVHEPGACPTGCPHAYSYGEDTRGYEEH
jgi:hypothetical protein